MQSFHLGMNLNAEITINTLGIQNVVVIFHQAAAITMMMVMMRNVPYVQLEVH